MLAVEERDLEDLEQEARHPLLRMDSAPLLARCAI